MDAIKQLKTSMERFCFDWGYFTPLPFWFLFDLRHDWTLSWHGQTLTKAKTGRSEIAKKKVETSWMKKQSHAFQLLKHFRRCSGSKKKWVWVLKNIETYHIIFKGGSECCTLSFLWSHFWRTWRVSIINSMWASIRSLDQLPKGHCWSSCKQTYTTIAKHVHLIVPCWELKPTFFSPALPTNKLLGVFVKSLLTTLNPSEKNVAFGSVLHTVLVTGT